MLIPVTDATDQPLSTKKECIELRVKISGGCDQGFPTPYTSMRHGATEAIARHANFVRLVSMLSGHRQAPRRPYTRQAPSPAHACARERQRRARHRISRSVFDYWETPLGQRDQIHLRQLVQKQDPAQLPTTPCRDVVTAVGARTHRSRTPRRGVSAPSEAGTGTVRDGQSRTLESLHQSYGPL